MDSVHFRYYILYIIGADLVYRHFRYNNIIYIMDFFSVWGMYKINSSRNEEEKIYIKK